MKYSDQLKDQRWVDRSNEIKERDKHTCQRCGTVGFVASAKLNHNEKSKEINKNKPYNFLLILNVHHKYYIPNTMAWEYPDEALITWCKKCHREEEILRILQELNSLFTQRMSIYKANLVTTSKRTKNEYNQLSNNIAKLREKLRKIENV